MYVSWKDSCLLVKLSCQVSYKNMCKYLARTVLNHCENDVEDSCKVLGTNLVSLGKKQNHVHSTLAKQEL